MVMEFIIYFNWTPLHWASYQKNIKFCKILLEFGADPQKTDYEIHLINLWNDSFLVSKAKL